MTALAGAAVAATAQAGRLAVNRHTLPAPWLPKPLRGLTITHISDLHVGRHYRPYMLRQLVDRANALDSDLVLLTGDIVDQSNDLLPPALHALAQLTHRYGLFICIGNHDQIDSRRDFIRRVGHRFPLLINQQRSVNIDGQHITIAGLDYASRDESSSRRPGHRLNIAQTLLGHDSVRHGPIIVLSHHPHAFDRLADAGVPLTLAGHTHGGQLMFSNPQHRPDVGIGRLLFRYPRGFYRRGPGTLFVNSGVGNWFPLRLRAPAEIVQLRLV
jgi:predicted MPP superfamily phosphohydrolase